MKLRHQSSNFRKQHSQSLHQLTHSFLIVGEGLWTILTPKAILDCLDQLAYATIIQDICIYFDATRLKFSFEMCMVSCETWDMVTPGEHPTALTASLIIFLE